MPTTLDDLKTFLCEKCRYVTCETKGADGRICGKVAKKGLAELQSKKKAYKCGERLTAEKSKKSFAAADVRK